MCMCMQQGAVGVRTGDARHVGERGQTEAEGPRKKSRVGQRAETVGGLGCSPLGAGHGHGRVEEGTRTQTAPSVPGS